jgi:hypothetical protein
MSISNMAYLNTFNITNRINSVGNILSNNITAGNQFITNSLSLIKRNRSSYANANNAMSSWIGRVSSNETNSWGSICWSPELGIFVSVAYGGTNRVMTSPDGITWTGRNPSSDSNGWTSVCWAPELGLFVAVANSGTNRVMTSPDGITWTGRTSAGESSSWINVCWSSELGIFVAVAWGGTPRVMTSYDGIIWTSRTSSNDSNDWYAICWSPELSIFVAVAGTGTNRVMTSPDGITWTGRTSANESNNWQSVCWSGELGLFVATATTGTDKVMTSPNGINWTIRPLPNNNSGWSSVTVAPELGLFVAVGSTGANRLMTSPDAVNWTFRNTSNDTNLWGEVCWSPELSTLVAVSPTGSGRRVSTSKIAIPNSKSAVLANPSQFNVNLSTGNVGIGTTAPSATLDVNGSINQTTWLSRQLVQTWLYGAGNNSIGGGLIRNSVTVNNTQPSNDTTIFQTTITTKGSNSRLFISFTGDWSINGTGTDIWTSYIYVDDTTTFVFGKSANWSDASGGSVTGRLSGADILPVSGVSGNLTAGNHTVYIVVSKTNSDDAFTINAGGWSCEIKEVQN